VTLVAKSSSGCALLRKRSQGHTPATPSDSADKPTIARAMRWLNDLIAGFRTLLSPQPAWRPGERLGGGVFVTLPQEGKARRGLSDENAATRPLRAATPNPG